MKCEVQYMHGDVMQKKKVLMISDHQMSSSGVGTQSRFLIKGLIETGKWTFRCFGAAMKHEDKRTLVVSDDFIIRPIEGFCDPMLLRQTLVVERPDVLLLFTDPRFFTHIFQMEDEVHDVCPIAYWTIWDNGPHPKFNKIFYDSVDALNCINRPAYDTCSKWFPERTRYIPHAVPSELYFRMTDQQRLENRVRVLGSDKADHFVCVFVGRNARRKMVPDIMLAWKLFVDQLQDHHGHRKATLVLHTDPKDPVGADLIAVADQLEINNNVVFSNDKIEFNHMNVLYNIADLQINLSSAEGFGLPTLEGGMTGLPMIAIKTGGLTRQVEDHITGYEYGIALTPDVKSLIGTQNVPYIYEDLVSHETVVKGLVSYYEKSQEEKDEISKKIIEHCNRDYSMDQVIADWDDSLTSLVENWQANRCGRKRWVHVEV